MMRLSRKLTFAVTLAFGLVGLGTVMPAAAQPVQMLAEKDWVAYRVDEGGKRTCFISSVPLSQNSPINSKVIGQR